VFEAMMHFIYTGAMTASPGVAQDLLRAADKYQLDALKKRCEAGAYTLSLFSST
jgi:hypothetical protein